VNRALTARDSTTRASLKSAFENLGYEVIPFKKTEEQVLHNVPKHVRLTVTASPAKGQDATVDLTVRLAGHGYSVAPHSSSPCTSSTTVSPTSASAATPRGTRPCPRRCCSRR